MSYKIIFVGFDQLGSGGNTMIGTFWLIDQSVNQIVDQSNSILTFGVDLVSYTPSEIIAAQQSQILAWASGHGYSITAADIDWQGITQFTLTQGAALLALLTPAVRVFSTPTFTQATTATQLSATRDAQVSYDFDATVAISLLAGQSVTALLQYADNSGMSTNVVTVSSQTVNNSGVLGLTQINTLKLSGDIPAGKFRKVTFTVTGGATAPAAIKAGQEILL